MIAEHLNLGIAERIFGCSILVYYCLKSEEKLGFVEDAAVNSGVIYLEVMNVCLFISS